MRGGFCGTLAVVPVPCAETDTDAAVDAAGEELVEVAAVTPAREAISPSQDRACSLPYCWRGWWVNKCNAALDSLVELSVRNETGDPMIGWPLGRGSVSESRKLTDWVLGRLRLLRLGLGKECVISQCP